MTFIRCPNQKCREIHDLTICPNCNNDTGYYSAGGIVRCKTNGCSLKSPNGYGIYQCGCGTGITVKSSLIHVSRHKPKFKCPKWVADWCKNGHSNLEVLKSSEGEAFLKCQTKNCDAVHIEIKCDNALCFHSRTKPLSIKEAHNSWW